MSMTACGKAHTSRTGRAGIKHAGGRGGAGRCTNLLRILVQRILGVACHLPDQLLQLGLGDDLVDADLVRAALGHGKQLLHTVCTRPAHRQHAGSVWDGEWSSGL